jgi:cellulose synthase/poly-beta-1,6-N-acetylglucosamine synthase-like glycosyltransferase
MVSNTHRDLKCSVYLRFLAVSVKKSSHLTSQTVFSAAETVRGRGEGADSPRWDPASYNFLFSSILILFSSLLFYLLFSLSILLQYVPSFCNHSLLLISFFSSLLFFSTSLLFSILYSTYFIPLFFLFSVSGNFLLSPVLLSIIFL